MSEEVSTAPFNTHEQVGHGGVYITYLAPNSRSVIPPRSKVVRVGYKTDPGAAWYDYGCKTFVGKRSESMDAAKVWATERYGIKNWKRNASGDLIDADAGYPKLRRG